MAFAKRAQFGWRTSRRVLELGKRTLVMGVLNVTPDSFSDGGLFLGVESAVRQGISLLDAGADVLDLGGESTRPGASPASAQEEMGRLLPVLRRLGKERPRALFSVDTYHADTARAALDLGAEIINDVSGGLWNGDMAQAWFESGCGVVLMHTRGRPQEWGRLPALKPDEVVPLVMRELRTRLDAALGAGVQPGSIMLDPGFGFGKSMYENYSLLSGLERMQEMGRPVLVGVSRKGFLRRTMEGVDYDQANAGALQEATSAANVAAILGGAHMLRVHDVAAARRAAAVADRILESV